MPFSIDNKLKELLKDPGALEVLNKHVPDLSKSTRIKLVSGMSFRKIASFPQANMTPEKLAEIDADLQALE